MARRIELELGRTTELVVVKTTGDRIQNVSLAEIGGKGLFVKEIEEALLDGRADVAVHSAKDLPASLEPGLCLAAFPQREDARDALVAADPALRLSTLPKGARIGTGSARRTALLLAARPDLEVVPLRGNVPTRLAKLASESLDAVVLACAGLDRLGLGDRITERIEPDQMLPAVCQGMLALEARSDDPLARDLETLSSSSRVAEAAAERGFLIRLGGDCTVPLAAHSEPAGDGALRVRGLVASADGAQVWRAERSGPVEEAAALGRAVADAVVALGGDALHTALPSLSAGIG